MNTQLVSLVVGQESTQEYFKLEDYKVGDIFSEFLSFYIYIIKVIDNTIITIEGNSDKLELKETIKEKFKKRLSYSGTNMSDKYWVYYMGNDINKINKVLKFYKRKSINKIENRNIDIESIIYDL